MSAPNVLMCIHWIIETLNSLRFFIYLFIFFFYFNNELLKVSHPTGNHTNYPMVFTSAVSIHISIYMCVKFKFRLGDDKLIVIICDFFVISDDVFYTQSCSILPKNKNKIKTKQNKICYIALRIGIVLLLVCFIFLFLSHSCVHLNPSITLYIVYCVEYIVFMFFICSIRKYFHIN